VGAERVLIVNSALSWDPMSVRFTSPLGAHYVPRDADGRTDETGWQLHLLANTTYTVSVRVCCESPLASVTLDVGGTALTLTDPDGDGKYEAPYTTPATGISALVLTMMVTCDGATSESVSEALIDPDGVVTDIKTGATLSDANVVCLVQGAGSAPNATYSVWPADSFGQINPQKTKADGYFAFFTPAGIYRLDVSRSGYQPYSSPDLNVVATPVRHDVALTPLIAQTANQTVTIEATGFNPVSITIPMGGVVKWLNADAKSHAIKGTTGAGIDSGMLAPGASYTWQATQAGQFSVFDTASERSMVVHVMDGVDAQFKVLLPLVRK
jgi:plastocyanin